MLETHNRCGTREAAVRQQTGHRAFWKVAQAGMTALALAYAATPGTRSGEAKEAGALRHLYESLWAHAYDDGPTCDEAALEQRLVQALDAIEASNDEPTGVLAALCRNARYRLDRWRAAGEVDTAAPTPHATLQAMSPEGFEVLPPPALGRVDMFHGSPTVQQMAAGSLGGRLMVTLMAHAIQDLVRDRSPQDRNCVIARRDHAGEHIGVVSASSLTSADRVLFEVQGGRSLAPEERVALQQALIREVSAWGPRTEDLATVLQREAEPLPDDSDAVPAALVA